MPFQTTIYNRLMPGDFKYQQTIADGDQEHPDWAIFLDGQEYHHPTVDLNPRKKQVFQ